MGLKETYFKQRVFQRPGTEKIEDLPEYDHVNGPGPGCFNAQAVLHGQFVQSKYSNKQEGRFPEYLQRHKRKRKSKQGSDQDHTTFSKVCGYGPGYEFDQVIKYSPAFFHSCFDAGKIIILEILADNSHNNDWYFLSCAYHSVF